VIGIIVQIVALVRSFPGRAVKDSPGAL
jgi:hypothetical protein